MKKSKWMTVTFILLFTLLAAAIGGLIFSGRLHSEVFRNVEAEGQQVTWYFEKIGDDIKNTGLSPENRKQLDEYLSTLPAEAHAGVLVFGEDGKVQYSAATPAAAPTYATGSVLQAVWKDYNFILLQDSKIQCVYTLSKPSQGSVGGAEAANIPVSQFVDSVTSSENPPHYYEPFHYANLLDEGTTASALYVMLLYDNNLMGDPFRAYQPMLDWSNWLNSASWLALFVFWLLLPVWVFFDARRRQSQSLPWALLVLLTNVVGLVVYWIVHSQNAKITPLPTCPSCGKTVHRKHLFCPWCAAPLVKNCSGCGKALEKGWVACPWCGKRVE